MKPLSDCRVLIVDDARPNLDLLVEGLGSDHRLSVATSGEAALQIAARTPPDLVLLDIVMPGLDGYEVCRRLRQLPATAEVPIMFLSSLEEVGDKTRGFEAGANDYLTKPFEMLEVKARVRSLLKAKAYGDAVKEQLASELRVAREIQEGMLPHDLAGLERAHGVELGAVLEPARQVGGDLYGACAAAGGRLVLFLGDVSGKGIPASMFMVRAVSLARLLARELAEPERILARLNDELAVDNPSGMFVTFLCAVLEPGSGRLTLANAGHCRPALLRPGEPPRWAVPRLGTALGFEPGLAFERTELRLGPGDALVFYTDGVTEAFDPTDACYGSERLLADAGALTGRSAAEITSRLHERVRAFAGAAPQSDDLAIVTLRVPAPPSVMLELHASPQEVMRGVDALREFCRAHGVPEPAQFPLALALEECASNVVNHALQGDARQTFRVTFSRAAEGIVMEVRDRGPPFDPTAISPPDGAEPDAEDRHGGWGAELARRSLRALSYRREGAENVLRLTGRPDAPAEEPSRDRRPAAADAPPPNGGSTAMPLEIQILQDVTGRKSAPTRVRLAGSLDTATAPELEKRLAPVLARSVLELVFDLADLKFVSSAGLRVFSMVRKQLKERGGHVAFVNLQPQIAEVFEIIKALPGMTVFRDLAEFDRYIAARQRSYDDE
jgi:sigma-B regulation protein RsbU (phosphoserine phosphatase)